MKGKPEAASPAGLLLDELESELAGAPAELLDEELLLDSPELPASFRPPGSPGLVCPFADWEPLTSGSHLAARTRLARDTESVCRPGPMHYQCRKAAPAADGACRSSPLRTSTAEVLFTRDTGKRFGHTGAWPR